MQPMVVHLFLYFGEALNPLPDDNHRFKTYLKTVANKHQRGGAVLAFADSADLNWQQFKILLLAKNSMCRLRHGLRLSHP
ncbi:hypothetical protein LUW10_14930 [Pseudomonas veronii]|uniref:hypothetical protein n=1 Tax=Pseudomonas veronii TaxID=76761 RepID=UPI001E632BD9|nr:hypothetical protein [Pseudomonas veronii]UHH33037.1 hypothetical protein LUW10_14930 [Pseudomonas veronii]